MHRQNPDEGWTRQEIAIAVLVLAMIALITVLDLEIWPRYYLALFYAVPVILAMGNLPTKAVIGVAALSALLTIVDTVVTGVPVNLWGLLLLAVIVYGYLLNRRRRVGRS